MATKTFDQLINEANKIKTNELPGSNSNNLVGGHLLAIIEKLKELFNSLNNEDISSAVSSFKGIIDSINTSSDYSENSNGDIFFVESKNTFFLKKNGTYFKKWDGLNPSTNYNTRANAIGGGGISGVTMADPSSDTSGGIINPDLVELLICRNDKLFLKEEDSKLYYFVDNELTLVSEASSGDGSVDIVTEFSETPLDTKVPSEKLVKDALNNLSSEAVKKQAGAAEGSVPTVTASDEIEYRVPAGGGGVSVVQSIGASKTNVMSQAAVSSKDLVSTIDMLERTSGTVGTGGSTFFSLGYLELNGGILYMKIKCTEGSNEGVKFYLGSTSTPLIFVGDTAEVYAQQPIGRTKIEFYKSTNSGDGCTFTVEEFKHLEESFFIKKNIEGLESEQAGLDVKIKKVDIATISDLKPLLAESIINNNYIFDYTPTITSSPTIVTPFKKTDGPLKATFIAEEGNEVDLVNIYVEGIGGSAKNFKAYYIDGVAELLVSEDDFNELDADNFKITVYIAANKRVKFLVENINYGSLHGSLNEDKKSISKINSDIDTIAFAQAYVKDQRFFYQKFLTISADVNDVDADFTGATSIREAINSITDASAINRCAILVKPGLYRITKNSQYSGTDGQYKQFFTTKNYVDIIGLDPRMCIFEASIEDPYEDARDRYQAVYTYGFCMLKNITIVGHNMRYAIHRDGGSNFFKAENCIIKTTTAQGGGGSGTGSPWGTGTHDGEITEIVGGESTTDNATPLAIHTNVNFKNPSGYTVRNHRFTALNGGKGYSVEMREMGSGCYNYLDLQGCSFSFNKIIDWAANTSSIQNNPLGSAGAISNCHNFQLIGYGNDKFRFVNTGGAKTLCVKTSSATKNSKVIFKGGTAEIAFSHFKNYKTIRPDDNYADEGYIYSFGAYNKPAECIGLVPAQYWGQILGDCTSTNKNLIIEVDGEDVDVVFNENYSSGAENKVIAKINAALGSKATAISYPYVIYYFAECTDILEVCPNSSSDDLATIKAGRLVILDTNGVSIANSASKFIHGVAIDTIAPLKKFKINNIDTYQGFGRIVKNTYLAISNDENISRGFAFAANPISSIDFGEMLCSNENGELCKGENGFIKVVNINGVKCIEI